jgi:murein DD-endopeptidase MepM/ murein hydrolase activator NlpD
MQQAQVATTTSQQIFAAAKDVYDLTSVRVGRRINLIYDKQTNELVQLIYPIDTEEELYITLKASTTATSTPPVWTAERIPIPYEIKIKTAEGIIETSMYEAALAKGIDERAVIGFADAFQWTIDFAWEVQKGDSFKFIYEERYRDGKYVMPGQILAGKFVNNGKTFYAFYYIQSDDSQGFFDENGESAEKIFLKAPVAFKYITSGFTTGLRYIEAFNMATGHRAIDYAATYGTPIRTVGDGTVVFAGWNGAYGQMVKVRHNSTYQTNYGHMSKIAVRVGQQVSQGQTIGYVGSTGLSTGPHLHYEMEKNGTKINPLKEVFPPSQGIKEENKPAYLVAIKDLKEKLDNSN